MGKTFLKYFICVLLFVVGFANKIKATEQDSLYGGSAFSVLPSQLLVREINFGYEKFLNNRGKNISIVLGLAYRIPKDGNKEFISLFFYDKPQYYVYSTFPLTKSYAVMPGLKIYLKPSLKGNFVFYLEGQSIYRYNGFHRKFITYKYKYNISRYVVDTSLVSVDRHTFGVKILAGFKMISMKNKTVNVFTDFYVGAGLRTSYWNKTVYGSGKTFIWDARLDYYFPYENFLEPKKTKGFELTLPSFHLGLKLGFGWKHRS